MSSYYNIFKDTEFITQNTDSKNTYKLLRKIYQQGGNTNDVIYEDIDTNLDISKQKINADLNSKFINSCKQSKVQNFKQPMIQIGGFYIQL